MIDNLEDIFSQLINYHRKSDTRLVLALSGGVDSRVLLALMAHYQQQHPLVPCLTVHVHHGLSANADQWATQCQRWSAAYNIPCVIEYVQLDRHNGDSLEQQARHYRYQALQQHLQPNDLLLTAQHSDDQIETFLLALKRGSGPKGLASMAQSKELINGAMLLRPLLAVARSKIEAYAIEHQLEWVEDESNLDTRFDRNFIRHHVTPILNARWPGLAQAVQRSATLCAEQEMLLDQMLMPLLQAATALDGSLSIALLSAQTELTRNRLIRMWLDQQQQSMPSKESLALIWSQVALAKQDANPQFNLSVKPTRQIRRFQQRLYLVEQHQSLVDWRQFITREEKVQLPDGLGEIQLRACKTKSDSQDPSLSQATVYNVICHRNDEWSICFDPEGLSAHPQQRAHSHKLKKLYQEYGIPSWQRRRLPIIMSGSRVVAVMGVFVDRAFAYDAKASFVSLGDEATVQKCELIWYK